MNLLLDEHLPHQFRQEITGHDVYTVAYMGWAGVENGELMLRAESQGFDAIITNDGGVQHEPKLAALPVAVVFLNAGSQYIGVAPRFCARATKRPRNSSASQFCKT